MKNKIANAFCMISVLGVDTIMKENMTSVVIPKYNNKVQDPSIFDDFTKIVLPVDQILTEPDAEHGKNSLVVRMRILILIKLNE